MKKDSLRTYLEKASEAYCVAADPPVLDYDKFGPRIVKRRSKKKAQVKPEDREPLRIKEEEAISNNKMTCLEVGIDVKYIVIDFLGKLEGDHGSKRGARLKRYLSNGYIENMPYKLRYEIKTDARRLNAIITRYKIDGKIL